MTITICSGLIVFPQKLIVLQIGEINCLKSQVDRFLNPVEGGRPCLHLDSRTPKAVTSSDFLPLGVLMQRQGWRELWLA